MNKKLGVYILLFLIASTLIGAALVQAQDAPSAAEQFKGVQKFVSSFVSPIGFEDQWTGIVLGIIAMVMLLAIIYDVATIVLPFSDWVCWIISIGFVLAGAMLGMVRSIAGWAVMLGAYLTGTAGTIAIVMSGFLLALGIIGIFFAGTRIGKFIQKFKTNRENMEKEIKAMKKAGDVNALTDLAKGVAGHP